MISLVIDDTTELVSIPCASEAAAEKLMSQIIAAVRKSEYFDSEGEMYINSPTEKHCYRFEAEKEASETLILIVKEFED